MRNMFPILSQRYSILVHGRERPYLMEKMKWPKLVISDQEESMGVLTQEKALLGAPGMGSSGSQVIMEMVLPNMKHV